MSLRRSGWLVRRGLLVLGLCICVGIGLVPASSAMPVVDTTQLELDRGKGVWRLSGQPFTGRTVELVAPGVEEVTEWSEGRRHGLREVRSHDGRLLSRTVYRQGRRHGEALTWWSSGTLRKRSHFVDGRANGLQQQFYESGAPFKELNLVDGAEVGMQRAWRENGAIYANYEVRDGRAYGLRRAKPCFEVTAEDTELP